MNDVAPRYAVYWAPEAAHPLWRAGFDWLGRDPAAGDAGEPPPLRRSPWRYGFHATLKAPMRLREGATADAFANAVQALAASVPAFELPALHVDWVDDFIALRPLREARQGEPLYELAARCVRELDAWRVPTRVDAAEARRDTGPLDVRQQELLAKWGYAHVLDRWRFHLTLSDALDPASQEARALFETATEHFAAALREPVRVRSVCVFEEAAAGAPLGLLRRYPLAFPSLPLGEGRGEGLSPPSPAVRAPACKPGPLDGLAACGSKAPSRP